MLIMFLMTIYDIQNWIVNNQMLRNCVCVRLMVPAKLFTCERLDTSQKRSTDFRAPDISNQSTVGATISVLM